MSPRASMVSTEARAEGKRAAQVPSGSQTLPAGRTYPRPISQYTRGGLSNRGNPLTLGVSQSPVSAMARPDAANKGGVSSTRPVLPSFQQKIATASTRMSSIPCRRCRTVGRTTEEVGADESAVIRRWCHLLVSAPCGSRLRPEWPIPPDSRSAQPSAGRQHGRWPKPEVLL